MQPRRTVALTAEGHSAPSIRRLVAAGELHRVRRGVYADSPPADDSVEEAHLRLIRATMPLLLPTTAVSHSSAGLLHRLPVWKARSSPVTVTRPGEGGNRSRHVHLRCAGLPRGDVTRIEGIAVTTLARTLVDVGRTETYERVVATLDAGLRRGVDQAALEERLELLGRARGTRTLRAALGFADGRAESPGESISRVVLSRLGIPRPELQFEIFSTGGRLVARVDFAWPDLGVVGEFDGRVKYDGTYGRTTADAVMAEKRREAALVAAGWRVVRWTWSDLGHPERIAAMWRTAC